MHDIINMTIHYCLVKLLHIYEIIAYICIEVCSYFNKAKINRKKGDDKSLAKTIEVPPNQILAMSIEN